MPSSPARQGGYLSRPGASSLAQVVETILDKGLVIDAYVRVNLLGIELVTVDARFVVASADTYLRYAEAVDRLELEPKATSPFDLEEKATEKYVEGTVKGVVEGAQEGVGDLVQEVKDSVHEVAGEVADKLLPDR